MVALLERMSPASALSPRAYETLRASKYGIQRGRVQPTVDAVNRGTPRTLGGEIAELRGRRTALRSDRRRETLRALVGSVGPVGIEPTTKRL